MAIEMELVVVAVHGEADQETVNKLQEHRNKIEFDRFIAHNTAIPPYLAVPANEAPDVLILLRCPDHDFRIEWPVKTWGEIARWKKLIGYDSDRRHWKHGAKVKVSIGE